MASELTRAVLMAAAFLVVFALAEAWRALLRPPAEWTRKLVHFAGGLLVLSFPWVFERSLTVVVLAATFGALVWGTRRLGILDSVHGVGRRSEGGLLYPVGVIFLFVMAHDRPAFYLAPALALIVSDSAAAVLGSIYGRTTYEVESDRRSFEGSSAFFFATFLAVHLPLLLMTEVDRGVSVLMGVQIALLVTLFEGVSLRGIDNLMIPLVAYYLLDRFAGQPLSSITVHVAALLTVLILLSLVAWRWKILKVSGVMAAALFFYAVYALGGPAWLVAPTMALLSILLLRSIRGETRDVPTAQFQVVATFHATLVAMVVLVANDVVPALSTSPDWSGDRALFITLFAGAITGQLGIVFTTQIRPFGPENRAPLPLPATMALCLLGVVTTGFGGLWAGGALTTPAVVTVVAIAFTASLIYWSARHAVWLPAVAPWNMRLQSASVALATAVVLPVRVLLTS